MPRIKTIPDDDKLQVLEGAAKRTTILTHSGVHHVDEVLAIAIIALAMVSRKGPHPDIYVVRTRSKKLIKVGQENKKVLVVDVGARYDGEHLFDHHQRSLPARFNDKVIATAGLVAERFLRDAVWASLIRVLGRQMADQRELDILCRKVQQRIIQPSDLHDNGLDYRYNQGTLSLFDMIADMNAQDEDIAKDRDARDEAFEEAVNQMMTTLVNHIRRLHSCYEGTIMAHRLIDEAVASGSEILYMDTECPGWKTTVRHRRDACGINFGMYPVDHDREYWELHAVNPGKAFLPPTWRSLEDRDLERRSNLPYLVYCHKDGHFVKFWADGFEEAKYKAQGILERVRQYKF